MKWAFVSTMEGCPWGGSEELWSRVARGLLEGGHEIHANIRFWPNPARQVTELIAAGAQVTFRRLDRRKKLQSLLHRLGGGGYVPPVHLASRRWLERIRPQAVVISQGASFDEWSLFFSEECRRRDIPYALITQANSLLWMPSDELVEPVTRMFVQARRAYFVSEGNRRLLEKQIGQSLPNAEVVFNPFNVSFEARPPWPEEHSPLRLGCVARMEPAAKGQDVLFETLALPKWRARDVCVTLAGTGPWEKGLRRYANWLELTSVHFAGFVSDIEAFWRNHHALVLPSRHEGLPLALVEALLCGRPAIVTDIPGNTELLTDGVTGFIARAPDVVSLDEALERAYQHREELPRMGARAAEAIRQRIPRDPARVMADKLLEVFS
ncbi:glycosyltransferase family 4 protein [Chloracidobacterium thermophilum]|uniref:glycosyltransferase family 4 protein n=1 Tax=Chloracidobacterium thermophilum TaxID=458033 RepID=UPI0007398EC0|nr:glycosyltransferase family 4 protein [Chloracidobacterium thermophilum]